MVRKAKVHADPVAEVTPASSAPKRGGRPQRSTAKANAAPARSRSARVPTVQEEEEFDIDAELGDQASDSEIDDDTQSCPPPNAPRLPRARVYDPFVDPSRTQSTKTSSTADVLYFFERTAESSVCTHCRYRSTSFSWESMLKLPISKGDSRCGPCRMERQVLQACIQIRTEVGELHSARTY